jgi:aspartate/methionine/tyrosine aminotransferase
MKLAARSDIPPFYVMEVMKAAAERQRAGGKVLHMEVGQPSTAAPARVLAAAEQALRSDRLGYTNAAGIDPLRERIARHYLETAGIGIDAGRIVITAGASGGFVLTLLAAFDVGDRVGITEPGYAAYRNIIRALGLELVGIPVGPASRFVPTPADIDAAGPLDGMVLASPSNPTGTILTRAERGIRVISDEIYHRITYTGPAPSALEISDGAVVVQSFSKYYSMTGWRLGWLVLPTELVRPVERLAQNLFIAPSTLAQLAAVTAFDCTPELDANVARYARNREVVIGGLREMGIQGIAPADGAFYVWADVSGISDDSQELCRSWLDQCGVAVTPGIDFDPKQGLRHVRFSYSESTEDVTEAMTRLAAFRW